eukprot:4919638-Amphidinium_carterae.1
MPAKKRQRTSTEALQPGPQNYAEVFDWGALYAKGLIAMFEAQGITITSCSPMGPSFSHWCTII